MSRTALGKIAQNASGLPAVRDLITLAGGTVGIARTLGAGAARLPSTGEAHTDGWVIGLSRFALVTSRTFALLMSRSVETRFPFSTKSAADLKVYGVSWNHWYAEWYQGGSPLPPISAKTRSVRPAVMRSPRG